jgi:hypothetical protein
MPPPLPPRALRPQPQLPSLQEQLDAVTMRPLYAVPRPECLVSASFLRILPSVSGCWVLAPCVLLMVVGCSRQYRHSPCTAFSPAACMCLKVCIC